MTERAVLGAVLAGGESRRLGRDKAAEPVGRVPMLDRAVASLRPHCAEVIVVTSREDPPAGDWAVVPDLRAGLGPLGGIETALDRAEAEGYSGAFVLACDLPLVDAAVVGTVLDAWGDAPCAAPRRDGTPDFEPLCAVYRSSCLVEARALLDAGERAAWTLLERVGGVRVTIAGERLLNVNTEHDLTRAQAALSEPPGS